jgi:hypothetical protein
MNRMAENYFGIFTTTVTVWVFAGFFATAWAGLAAAGFELPDFGADGFAGFVDEAALFPEFPRGWKREWNSH